MNTDTFEMVAKTFQGLEEVLAEELRGLGAQNVEPGRRMVSFEGDKEMLYKANLHCRTALRILKPFYKFKAQNPEKLYDRVKEYDWNRLLTVDKTFVIEATVNSEVFTNSRFVTYKVKDAIADWFRDHDAEGRRPGIRLTDADVVLNVHISGTEVTMSLDSSGASLHRRGWREAQTEAPINEVLAAGIILKSGWRGDCPFVDPMCGSGTFLVEAALIAANIAPGIFRQGFAFEQWEDFDRELFERLYNDDSAEREITCRIIGADMSPKAIAIAQKNLKRAGVAKHVELELKPLSAWTEAPENGVLVTNPPYGERLKPADLEGLYDLLGEKLKHVFKGYHAWIIGYKDETMAHISLAPSSKDSLMNGSLQCELREYIIFEGSRRDFKSAGGSTRTRRVDTPTHKQFKQDKPKRERPERPEREEREPAAEPENPLAMRRNPKLLEQIGRQPKLSARKSWRR
ncbi:MAG: THUMP domain-containing protein [Bacteroides sp.]|nr:THUMP domain-containing protein [Bacteroides sp.]MCM1378894.1 THUMP domain-containing protein [Bacteroides sp.]MCM1445510.1 THUMP domain-containing protein [Prevotella sp.]